MCTKCAPFLGNVLIHTYKAFLFFSMKYFVNHCLSFRKNEQQQQQTSCNTFRSILITIRPFSSETRRMNQNTYNNKLKIILVGLSKLV